MKNVIKLITPIALMFLFAVSGNAQTASTIVKDGKQCDPKACAKICDVTNCDPKLCSALMAQCAKGTKTSIAETPVLTDKNVTRVAAASAERSTPSTAKKAACTAGKSKKCCAKKSE